MKIYHTVKAIILSVCFLYAEAAFCTVSARPESKRFKASPQEHVTTDIAKRAHNDVSIRRLLTLFSEKKVDSNILYERLRAVKNKR